MSDSIKERNSNNRIQNNLKNCINFSLIQKVQKKREKKQNNENNNIKSANSKLSLIDKDLYIPLDKISKTIDKNTLHTTVHKIRNLVDFSKMKKNKIKIKNNFFTNISNIVLSLQESKLNNDFYKNRGCVTSRDNLNRRKENAIDKDRVEYLTQRQNNNKLYQQKIEDSKKEKHISFHKIDKKNNLYFSLIENGKKGEGRNIKYINPQNNGKNNHLRTECSNKNNKKDYKDSYPISSKKENKTLVNSSKNKDKKIPIKIKKGKIKNFNSSIYNHMNNINNRNDMKINYTSKKNDNKTSINQNVTSKQKTLVLDLDETLIFTSFERSSSSDLCLELDLNINDQLISQIKNNRLNSLKKNLKTLTKVYLSKRPYLDKFLSQLNNYYEICIYSASSKKYASSIIDIIDTNNIISKKFFRDDCIHLDNSETFSYIKDLEKLNKNYNDIIIVDDNASSFILQNENGIPIKSWRGDKKDIELLKLIPILKNLSGFYDVRTEIRQFVINKTFIWFQGIKWLCNNCLSYSYIREMIKVMRIDQIPITNNILYFFMGEEYNTINVNSNYNWRNIGNETSFNRKNTNHLPLKPKNLGSNNALFNISKPRLTRRKIKKGKSANFSNKKEFNKNYDMIKSNQNTNKNRVTKKEIINKFTYNNITSRSGSLLQKDGKEKYTNIMDKLKNRKLKTKKTTNFIRENNDTYGMKKVRRGPKHAYSTANI